MVTSGAPLTATTTTNDNARSSWIRRLFRRNGDNNNALTTSTSETPLRSNTTNSNNNNNNNNNNDPSFAYQSYQDYQQPHDPLAAPPPPHPIHQASNSSSSLSSIPFRGFSTPISSMFQDVRYEGVDACSWICCGILQSDYNRYVVQGVIPPSWHRRCHLHLMIPLLVLAMAVYCAVHLQDAYMNQIITTSLVLMLLLYWMLQCCKGRAKRVSVRKELLNLKYYYQYRQQQRQLQQQQQHDDEENPLDDEEKAYQRLGQSYCNLQCAHAMLGCYPSDIIRYGPHENASLVEATRRKNDNLGSCLWRTLYTYNIFGGCGCGCCYLQCCGICATAQEGRELLMSQHPSHHNTSSSSSSSSNRSLQQQLLLPWHINTFVDYITFQPMLDYYPRIYRLRHESQGRSWSCYHLCCSLSKLSKWILSWAFLFLAILLLWSLLPQVLPQHHAFHIENYYVLLATLAYGMIALYLIHALWHLLDVSIDAVIKYYMTGFVLATTMAMVGEICLSLLIRIGTDILLAMSGINVVADSGYGSGSSSSSSRSSGGGSRGGDSRGSRGSSGTRYHNYYWGRGSGNSNIWGNSTSSNNTNNKQHKSRHSYYRLSSHHWWLQGVSNSILSHLYLSTSSSSSSSSTSSQPTHHDYLVAFGYAHPIFYTLYVALNSFVVAALVEEISKYLAYRMVPHPDWSTRRDLDRVQEDVRNINLMKQEQRQRRRRRLQQEQQLGAGGAGAGGRDLVDDDDDDDDYEYYYENDDDDDELSSNNNSNNNNTVVASTTAAGAGAVASPSRNNNDTTTIVTNTDDDHVDNNNNTIDGRQSKPVMRKRLSFSNKDHRQNNKKQQRRRRRGGGNGNGNTDSSMISAAAAASGGTLGAPQLLPAMDRGTNNSNPTGTTTSGPLSSAATTTTTATDSTRSQQQEQDPLFDFSLQDRTWTSRGAAITVAMIAVAVGFSSCENLVYVFFYAGAGASASVSIQWAVLIARSLFPVHIICAALQSIGVVQRDVIEQQQQQQQQQQGRQVADSGGVNGDGGRNSDNKKTRLGKILWPSLLFHGSYDFFIVWIEFMANRHRNIVGKAHGGGGGGGGGDGSNSNNSNSSNDEYVGEAIASLVVSAVLEIMAIMYYVWVSRAQRRRLQAMDGVTEQTTTTRTSSRMVGVPNKDGEIPNVDPSNLLL